MTTLRFVGELPLWIGLLLATLVALLSWRYYRRESFDLPAKLKWLLPALRSAAFFLGILLLTGPVLHHRETIGELGHVQIYVDGSSSMTLHDRHMAPARKLQIAEQLGWLEESGVDLEGIKTLNDLTLARRHFEASLQTAEAPEEVDQVNASNAAAVNDLLDSLRQLDRTLLQSDFELLKSRAIEPLEQLQQQNAQEPNQFDSITHALTDLESTLNQRSQAAIIERVNSGDADVAAALALFDDTPRWHRTRNALNDSPTALLATLREHHNVELRTLNGNSAEAIPLDDSSTEQTERAADELASTDQFSPYTDLSSGVVANQTGISASGEADTATPSRREAIVLITDGQHNFGPSPLQTARVLGNQGKPFYTVSLGASRPAEDLSVVALEHPDTVFARDRVRGILTLRDSMAPGQPFVAQMRVNDEVVWQQELTTQGTGDRKVEFEFPVEDVAKELADSLASNIEQHVVPIPLTAVITPLASEAEPSNNERSSRMAAILQNHRLLILDGRSRWETRYLRNAFSRDEQWTVNTVIAGPGAENESLVRGDQPDMFPTTRDALFDYDLIIFGEIAPDQFASHELDWLREFVEIRGGGLVFIDGLRGELRKLTEQDLLGLIPIEWLPDEQPAKPSSLELTDRGVSLAALRLVPDELENKRFWSQLPAPHRIVATEALPGSEVLLQTVVGNQIRPAMVTRTVGAGRVLYLAFDESWRWRYKAADTWHQRVWNQLAKFAMPQPFAVSDDYVSLDSGAVRYNEGDSVSIRARLKGLDGKPAAGQLIDALLWRNDRVVATVSLKGDPNVPGMYYGASGPLPAGDYQVSARASGYTSEALQARTEFTVNPPDIGELSQSSANEELLEQMALASGGQFLREEQIGQLPDLLSPLSSGRVVESETLIWQSYWWFIAMMLLLTAEWILRKRAGLL